MAVTTLDVRRIPPPERHPTIFSAFDALAPGEAVDLLNDHEPLPLHGQFERQRPGQYRWQVLQGVPGHWHVRIERTAAGPGGAIDSGCGGGCGCAGR